MNGNDTFLDINNAHLRVNNGNVQASTFVLDQIDFMVSSNASATVRFNNPTTAFLTASNIEVGTANLFVDTSTSNVGVGTDVPLHTLDVRGDMSVSSNLQLANIILKHPKTHIIENAKDNYFFINVKRAKEIHFILPKWFLEKYLKVIVND
jgi:hypothetical protein